jgi:hypothetical protein
MRSNRSIRSFGIRRQRRVFWSGSLTLVDFGFLSLLVHFESIYELKSMERELVFVASAFFLIFAPHRSLVEASAVATWFSLIGAALPFVFSAGFVLFAAAVEDSGLNTVHALYISPLQASFPLCSTFIYLPVIKHTILNSASPVNSAGVWLGNGKAPT